MHLSFKLKMSKPIWMVISLMNSLVYGFRTYIFFFFYIGSLIVLSGPQGVAYVELPSNLPSLEAKQQGPSVKSAR